MGTFFLVAAFAVVAILLNARGESRSHDHLTAWAERNGYTLVSVRRRHLTTRFFFRRSEHHRIYEFTAVHDETRRERSGAARVGGYLLGSWSPEVEVQWDD